MSPEHEIGLPLNALGAGDEPNKESEMERNEKKPVFPGEYIIVDVVAVERQARAMQSKVMAELVRTGWRRVSGLLRRAPDGQTA